MKNSFIDVHTHGIHAERDDMKRLIPPIMSAWKSNSNVSPSEQILFHNEKGIRKVFVVDPPEIAFGLKETFGDFVVPFPMIDMDCATPEYIDELFKRGAAGIKFIAPVLSYGDDAYMPLYGAVHENKGLAVFHTGYLCHGLFDPGFALERKHYVDIEKMRPSALDRIARVLPDLKILMAHFGNPWWEEAWSILKCNKNTYADFSGGTAHEKDMGFWKMLFAPNGKLHMQTVRKLCFGADGTHFLPNQSDYMVVLEFYLRFYEELKIPEEIRELINYRNAEMLIENYKTAL